MRLLTFRRFRRNEAGASAIEFALLAVPFLLLILGIFEFGRAFWAREVIQSVANKGARCMGVLHPNCAPGGSYSASATRNYIRNEASAMLVGLQDGDIELNNEASCSGLPGFSEVRVTYRFNTVVPLLDDVLSGGAPMEATACFPNQS